MERKEALDIIGKDIMPVVKEYWEEKTIKGATPEILDKLRSVWEGVLQPGTRLCIGCPADVKMALDVAGSWHEREARKADKDAPVTTTGELYVETPTVKSDFEKAVASDNGGDKKAAAPKKQSTKK